MNELKILLASWNFMYLSKLCTTAASIAEVRFQIIVYHNTFLVAIGTGTVLCTQYSLENKKVIFLNCESP